MACRKLLVLREVSSSSTQCVEIQFMTFELDVLIKMMHEKILGQSSVMMANDKFHDVQQPKLISINDEQQRFPPNKVIWMMESSAVGEVQLCNHRPIIVVQPRRAEIFPCPDSRNVSRQLLLALWRLVYSSFASCSTTTSRNKGEDETTRRNING